MSSPSSQLENDSLPATQTIGFQLAFSWAGVELHLSEPVGTFEEVLDQARKLKADEGDEHGYFYVTLQRTPAGEITACGGTFTNHQLGD